MWLYNTWETFVSTGSAWCSGTHCWGQCWKVLSAGCSDFRWAESVRPGALLCLVFVCPVCNPHLCVSDTDETTEAPSQLQVKDNTVRWSCHRKHPLIVFFPQGFLVHSCRFHLFQPLCNRLDTFCLDPTLVGKKPSLVLFPPEFQPIPCKPLFFDLALNHVAFPPLDDKVEQKGKGGLTGYIKGIFGFGS